MATKRRKNEPAAEKRYLVSYPWGLNLRSGPGVDFSVIRVLPEGTAVVQNGSAVDGWVPAAEGWVMARYLREV